MEEAFGINFHLHSTYCLFGFGEQPFSSSEKMLGEENVSLVSHSVIDEISDSNTQQQRLGNNLSSSKFRGVVPLPNGHWGCQIYYNHQRIWLGTFKSETDAAMAYDSAALKLRSGDCRRNFPLTDITIKEPNFQSYYTNEALLNMIKDGTYQLKFAAFSRTHMENSTEKTHLLGNNTRSTCTQLFQKELTPSDVGKLNRLVIPKKFAVKFFANLSVENEENEGLLTFADKSMKFWKFRYCYWKSSHSYVFTRGWNRFVKEKELKAFDVVVFSLCQCWENTNVTQTYYMIDVLNNASSSGNLLEASNPSIPTGMDNTEMNITDGKESNDADRKSFRLFGTEIV